MFQVILNQVSQCLSEGRSLILFEMKFKAAVMNLLVNLLVGLQGNLGVGVEVVPVKQVPEYQAVILLEVIQQVVVGRLVVTFQAGEDFRLVEVFPAVEDTRTGLALADFLVVFREEHLEVVVPLVETGSNHAAGFSSSPMAEDRAAWLCGFVEGAARVPSIRTGRPERSQLSWHHVQSPEGVPARRSGRTNHPSEAAGGSESACTA